MTDNDKFDYYIAYCAGLKEAIKQIQLAREFLRGSTYSTDRLVNLMVNSIEEHIKDMTDENRILCDKEFCK